VNYSSSTIIVVTIAVRQERRDSRHYLSATIGTRTASAGT